MAGIDAAGWTLIGLTVGTLVVLEGLLSADNALVLAVMVRHLPKAQQKRALRYGLIGAFTFRAVAVVFAESLLDFWYLKVVGGLYLLYLAIKNLASRGHSDGTGPAAARWGSGFWGTVIGVELADVAFSIDSILAAVAMADGMTQGVRDVVLAEIPVVHVRLTVELAVVYVGGILGIITMRFVAGYFLTLLDRFAGLAAGAYLLVGWIGLDLIGGGLKELIHPEGGGPPPGFVPPWLARIPLEMPGTVFWGGMALIVVGSLLYKPRGPTAEASASLVEAGKLIEDDDRGI